MAYIDGVFNTMGKIPTDANFWEQDIEQFVAGDTITSGFAQVIGEQVMNKLKNLDAVAYVRFASVYREFKDINTFMDELKKVLDK